MMLRISLLSAIVSLCAIALDAQTTYIDENWQNVTNPSATTTPLTATGLQTPATGWTMDQQFVAARAGAAVSTKNWTVVNAIGSTFPDAAPAAAGSVWCQFLWTPSATNYSVALVSPSFDASAHSTITLTFLAQVDNFNSTATNELFSVWYRDNTAVTPTWVQAQNFPFTTGDTSYVVTPTIDLSVLSGVNDFQIAFAQAGADSSAMDNIIIDNLSLIGSGTITPQPEMEVLNGATPIADGLVSDDLGNIGITAQQSVTYTINNTGAAALNLTGSPVVVVVSGTNTQGVAVVTQPATPVAATTGTVQFTVNYTVQAAGAFDFTISIDNDDSDENPYNWTVSGMGVAAPEINVQRGSTTIISGGTDAIGNRTFNQNSNLTYTVQNLGTATLNITSISISGEINCTATVTSTLTSVAAAANDTFTIQLNPTAAGAFSFQITIANDDGDEGTYTINVTGTGVKKKKKSSGNDEGCSTNGGSSSWLALVGLLGVLALATRLRASRE